MQPVEGIYAATFTPFKQDYSIHLDRIETYAEKLIQSKVDGIFINGTTGEFASLTLDERKQLTERWKEVVGEQIQVIVHVGGTCISDCQELARHAGETGVNGISAVAPYYFKPESMDELVTSIEMIASSAPEQPFYYYHIPPFTGVSFSMTDFLLQAGERVPNLHGVKFSSTNLTDAHGCLSIKEKPYTVFFGVDEILLSAMSIGIKAAVGSTYNFSMPVYQKMIEAFKQNDLDQANEYQVHITNMIRVIQQYGGLRALKAVMKVSGFDCGPFRHPVNTLNQEELSQLQKDLDSIGFFEFAR